MTTNQAVHNLKTWKEFYSEIITEEKTFELRWNDRDFKVGDILNLQEFDSENKRFTGRTTRREISFIFRRGDNGIEGIKEGFCILGLKKARRSKEKIYIKCRSFLSANGWTISGVKDGYEKWEKPKSLSIYISLKDESIYLISDFGEAEYISINYAGLVGMLVIYRQIPFNFKQ